LYAFGEASPDAYVAAADCDAAQRPLGGVVGHAQAAVIEETDEAAPLIEAAIALATLFLAESLARCLRSHVSNSATSGRLCSLQRAQRRVVPIAATTPFCHALLSNAC
jgi:hypothetical protein